jgi:hypothetical protein
VVKLRGSSGVRVVAQDALPRGVTDRVGTFRWCCAEVVDDLRGARRDQNFLVGLEECRNAFPGIGEYA